MMTAVYRWFENWVYPFRGTRESPAAGNVGGFLWHYVGAGEIRLLRHAGHRRHRAAGRSRAVLFRRAAGRHSRPAARRAQLARAVGRRRPRTAVHGRRGAGHPHHRSSALSALVDEQTITPGFYNLVRWQAHRHVSRQSYAFFQNDFAGRIATKVWQAGQATGDLMESFIEVVWFMIVYTVTTLALVAGLDLQAGGTGGDLDRRLRLAGQALSAGDPQACRGDRRGRLDDQWPHRRFLFQRADAEAVRRRRRRPLYPRTVSTSISIRCGRSRAG